MELSSQTLADLAKRINCTSCDPDLWELIFMHESFVHEEVRDEQGAGKLLEIIHHTGREALRSALLEYCLDKKGMDPIQTSRTWQAIGTVLQDLVQDFQLLSMCRVGISLKDAKPNKSLQEALAIRFVGGIIFSSSYNNLTSLVWPRIEAALFSSATALSYCALDPKSWLQEYVQANYRGKQPVYQVVKESGPDHQKTFECRVILPDGKVAEASTRSIKEAQKLAAAGLIAKYNLDSYSRSTQNKSRTILTANRNSLATSFLEYHQIPIDRSLLNAAEALAAKLKIENLKIRVLAIALSLPSSRYKGSQTNACLKLLGDAVVSLAFSVFTFHKIPIRVYAADNMARLSAGICSDLHFAALFDFLNLENLARYDRELPLSIERKADVVKAIAAAIYISFGDFSTFFSCLNDKLGSWCLTRASFIAENPLAIRDPKSFLQELLQAQKSYRPEYTDNSQSGPEHRPSFLSALALKSHTAAITISRGSGRTLKEAQQAAALAGLQLIVPAVSGEKLDPIGERFWKSYFDGLLTGDQRLIVGACGVEQFRMLNAFAAYLSLKAFSTSLPQLNTYLQKREIWDAIARSVGRLPARSPSEALALAKIGTEIITSAQPDNIQHFLSREVDDWLSELRKASTALKLPGAHIDYPVRFVDLSDLTKIHDWEISIKEHDNARIPESMFNHIVTILETLTNGGAPRSQAAAITAQGGSDWRCVTISVTGGSASKLQLGRAVDQLCSHAFFSGVVDAAAGDHSGVIIQSKGVSLESVAAHTNAYVEVIRRLYKAQSHFQSLYRILHDIKNQVVTVRNYAERALRESASRYSMFAAIQQMQNDMLGREGALRVYFRAVAEPPSGAVNLQNLIREYIARQLTVLPKNIRPQFTESLDSLTVMAKKDLLLSLLENLVQNATEAMPQGGVLSVSVSLRADDSLLIIEVGDTGSGIAAGRIRDLFTSLSSTKRKGMGLGLATIKTIVDQHNGLIDVKSKEGEGTKFTILLPMQREDINSDASARG
jgi:dsRNA-specific ribonuclease/signal transduction histidine kinase